VRATLACIALVLAVLSPAAAGSTSKARVSIATQNPFVVVGSGFHSRERVRVTVRADAAIAKTVVATLRGTFRVTFSDVQRQDRCSGLLVRAVGSRGTLAVAKLPQPMCMPQRAP
jgi:hypothetical protein